MPRYFYIVDETKPTEAFNALINDSMSFIANPKRPLFVLIALANQYDPERLPRIIFRQFTNSLIESLQAMVEHPELSWEFYERNPEVGSDLASWLSRKQQEETDPSESQSYPDKWDITHLALYDSDEDVLFKKYLENTLFEDFIQNIPPFTVCQQAKHAFLNAKFTEEFKAGTLEFDDVKDQAYYLFWSRNIEDEEARERFLFDLSQEFQFPDGFIKDDELSAEKRRILKIPCAIYALEKCGVKQEILNEIWDKHLSYGNVVKTKQLHSLLSSYKIQMKIRKLSIRKGMHKGRCKMTVTTDLYPAKTPQGELWQTISLATYNGHIMRDIDFELTFKGKSKDFQKTVPFIRLLHWAFENKVLEPFNAYEYVKDWGQDAMLQFDNKQAIERLKTKDPKSVFDDDISQKFSVPKNTCPPHVYFADFECSTDQKYHIPYMICFQHRGHKKIHTRQGVRCGEEFLQSLLKKYHEEMVRMKAFRFPFVRIYFHNLGYDFTFLWPYLKDLKMISKGNTLYSATGAYSFKGKKILFEFWNTYTLIPMSLRAAAETFLNSEKTKDLRKEAFPYEFYTYETFSRYGEWCPLEDFKNGFTEKQAKLRQQFEENLPKLDETIYNRETQKIHLMRYSEMYCARDVEVLSEVFNAFAKLLRKEPFEEDILKYRTISSLAYAWFLKHCVVQEIERIDHQGKVKRVFETRHDFYCYRKTIRYIIEKTIRGGRVMMRDNQKWHYLATEGDEGTYLVDFDARSLYPSAISKLWVTEGKPTYIYGNFTEQDFLKEFTSPDAAEGEQLKYQDGCLHLTYLNVRKDRHFPMLCIKDPQTKLNEYKNFHGEVDTWVNAIDLYNLIDYQNAEFKYDAAVVWTGKRHYECRGEIQKIYDFRASKPKKDPMNTIAKLMMNSMYGKSGMKRRDCEEEIVDVYKWRKNGEETNVKWEKVDNWRVTFNAKAYCIKQIEELDYDQPYARLLYRQNNKKVKVKYFHRDLSTNFGLFASNVLAMSKRIIGKVMTLIEDLEEDHPEWGPQLFYTDTDSMHVTKQMMKEVTRKYEEKYHMPLVGAQMCQFHDDFDVENTVGAIESVFNMKKVYADKLLLEDGSIAYHKRGKGFPASALSFERYLDMYNDKPFTVELTDFGVFFEHYKNGNIGTRTSFKRTIMTRECKEQVKRDADLLRDFEAILKQVAGEPRSSKRKHSKGTGEADESPTKRQKI